MADVEFKDVRKRLWNEIVALHSIWHEYKYLFGDTDDRVVLLNACAGKFIGMIQGVMIRELILAVSRLTDPPQSGRFDNMVIAQLLSDPNLDEHTGLRDELQVSVAAAVASAAAVRVHRNKHVAHLDHATALGNRVEPLPSITIDSMEQAIASLAAAYNVHGKRSYGQHAHFEPMQEPGSSRLVAIFQQSSAWSEWQARQPRIQQRSERGSV